jgi:hypothetical protein
VALKLLAPSLAEDEAFRERFLEVSQLAASLDHPNVVTTDPTSELSASARTRLEPTFPVAPTTTTRIRRGYPGSDRQNQDQRR